MSAASRVLSISVLSVAVLFCGAAHHTANAQTLFRWVQVGPEGVAVVRAITDNACPKVLFDGGKVATNVRAEINQKFGEVPPAPFRVRVCEAPVPRGSFTGTLEGAALPLARPDPKRIVVIGDSGCRVASKRIQDCNSEKAWPFARIARAAAAARPDLVIHVGDYEYREVLCPADEAKCTGSPEPYGWEAWKADFFAPAKPLLEAAPWVMVRGNHELCDRAGEGWFRFLDPAEFERSCRASTEAYIAKLGAFGVMVVDGAGPAEARDLNGLAEALRRQLADWPGTLPDELWIATHPPIGGELAQAPAGGQIKPMPENVSMIVSGHFHLFRSETYGGASVPQAVIGTGGTKLDKAGGPATKSTDVFEFGYMVWDKSDDGWSGTLFDPDGRATKTHCELKQRALHCD